MTEPPPHTADSSNHARPRTAVWLAACVVAAALLAFLASQATPRVKLLGLFPFGLGAVSAWGFLTLAERFNVPHSFRRQVGIVVLAAAVLAGFTILSYRDWQSRWDAERAAHLQRVAQILPSTATEPLEEIRRKSDALRPEATAFPRYLAARLEGFAEQSGRDEVWPSPVPEAVWGGEMLLGLLGAVGCLWWKRRSGGGSDASSDGSRT